MIICIDAYVKKQKININFYKKFMFESKKTKQASRKRWKA